MKVTMIRYTADADELLGEAAAICTGFTGDKIKAARNAIDRGHDSISEHAVFTFRVEGVSRVLLAQLTRHRIASFSVESQRYCGVEPEWIVPQTIVDAGYKHEYLLMCNSAYELMCEMIEHGVPVEDARYVIPQGAACRLLVTMNARELMHFFELRCCNRAQWEIRRMADLMLKECSIAAPERPVSRAELARRESIPAEGRGRCADADMGLPHLRSEGDEAARKMPQVQKKACQYLQARHDLALCKVLDGRERNRTMKLTQEQKQAIPQRRAGRKEIDAYYGLAAALSFLLEAAGDKADDDPGLLSERAKLVPGGLRDLRCAAALMREFVPKMLLTFEPEKRRSISKQMQHLRIKTIFGPEAHRDPETIMIPIEDVALLVRAATEACKVRMCMPVECSQCDLGKAIDRASFVSRGDRAWWEVFSQMSRGEDAEQEGA